MNHQARSRPPQRKSERFGHHCRTALPTIAVLVGIALTGGCDGSDRSASGDSVTSLANQACASDSFAKDASDIIARVRQGNPVPGVSAALFIPSLMTQPVTATAGSSAILNGHPLTANDRFLTGSVGKTFFAALALRLPGTGTLSLDAPVERYLPDAAVPAFAWITPRMLLSHISGIGEYDGAFMTSLIQEPLRTRERNDWLDVIRRNPPARAAAGTFRYSDLNYVVLAMVLDAVTPSGAYVAINNEFLQPLGLTGTVPSIAPRVPELVAGYDGSGSMFGADAMMKDGSLVYNPQFEYGGGGFASTPRDLAVWMAAFRQGKAFPGSLWAKVIARPSSLPDTAISWRGMGIHVDSGARGMTFGHSGYMPGYVTWMRWYERSGISVAMQVNSSDRARLKDDGFAWLDSLERHAAERVLACPAYRVDEAHRLEVVADNVK